MTAFSLRAWRRQPGKVALALGLAAVMALAWVYLLAGAGLDLNAMAMTGADMAMPAAWSLAAAAQNFGMWGTMMVAMMLPSAAPAIMQRLGAADEAADRGTSLLAALAFGAGYGLVWLAFSLAATTLQWALSASGLLSAMLALTSPALAGALILVIGLYQLTPFKQAALRHCRASAACQPGGAWAAARQGVRHGLACLAGCWGLMLLLFVVGLMNLAWIAAITLWMLAENNLAGGGRLARLGAAGLLAWGAIALVLAR